MVNFTRLQLCRSFTKSYQQTVVPFSLKIQSIFPFSAEFFKAMVIPYTLLLSKNTVRRYLERTGTFPYYFKE